MSHKLAVIFFLSTFISLPSNAENSALQQDIWFSSYDQITQTRYIPLELIIGAKWDGKREIKMPNGDFAENVDKDPSTWRGPSEWYHPTLKKKLIVYDRSRHFVFQKFALRTDNTAIGRVYDSRFNMICEEEAKYPLGIWKQGETRVFEYRCISEKNQQVNLMSASITIEKIYFEFAGMPASLQINWILKRADNQKELDNRIYVFSPDKGVTETHRKVEK
jgi:hypothetical protein